jgi:shikimate 5-dehydrogenase
MKGRMTAYWVCTAIIVLCIGSGGAAQAIARRGEKGGRTALVMTIGMINLWNRLDAATRQLGGAFLEQYV